jgi:hypothetical protein
MSNEEEEITNFYTRQATRTYCPDYETVVRVTNPQDEIQLNQDMFADLYLRSKVVVKGNTTLEVFGLNPVSEPMVVEAGSVRSWVTPDEISSPNPSPQERIDITVDGKIHLHGYEIATRHAFPGESINVVLYWEALQPITRNKQVFVHLSDDSLRAQHDGAPECDVSPTTHWEVGDTIRDTHIIKLPPDIQPGSYVVSAGLYDLLTLERMDIPNDEDDAIELTKITIAGE